MRIEKVSCLCLDKRKGLWENLENQVKDTLKIPMEKFIAGDGSDSNLDYDHIDVPKPPSAPFRYGRPETINSHYNAFLCHKQIFRRALDEGRQNLLLLEDDSHITERFNMVWLDKNIQEKIKSVNWDVIYLGWWMVRNDDQSQWNEDRPDIEQGWLNRKECGFGSVPRPPFLRNEISGFHGVLLSRKTMQWLSTAPEGPLDSYVGANMNHIKAFFVWPKIIHVNTCWSYGENSFVNRRSIE